MRTIAKKWGMTLIAVCFCLFTCGLHAQVTFKDSNGKQQTVATQEWVKEYFKSLQPPVVTPPVDNRPECKIGLTLLTVNYSKSQLEFTFHSLDVESIDYTIQNDAGVVLAGHTGKLTSSRVSILHSLPTGNYTLQIKAVNCKSDSVGGIKPFRISGEKSGFKLTPLKDPLLPPMELTGNYELRYIESRPDEHLDLRITEKDGQLYLTDVGTSLQSASYTLNGWTDPENCGKLENEPIYPYRKYQVSKYSIDRPSIRDGWMAIYATPKAQFKRSELFFFVVPKGETWNPVGESPNPIGRPAAFAKIPTFSLKNRVYGFEYDLLDETDARKKALGIQFNWQAGKKHLKLYASVLSSYLRKLPVRKGFEELTEAECIDFANTLPIEQIVAFDIEPGNGENWIINYDGANFTRNMALVIDRLKARGALAYNWLDVPSKSPNDLSLDGIILSTGGNYGNDGATFSQAFKRIGDVQRRTNPYSLISTGYGYAGYDMTFSEGDGNGQNNGPQLTYLRALDVTELWKRVWPEKEQVYFSWPFTEFDFVQFPGNHVVEIPEFQARARRTDNKPLYPPTQWEDNLTLGLLNAKYLFYWSPGPVSWNPAGVSSYNDAFKKNPTDFTVWTYEKGSTPQTGNFYIGKEAMALSATVGAAYTFSQIQDAADGSRTAPKFSYRRATKDGTSLATLTVEAITDGSWYNASLNNRQPFVILLENGNNRALLVQDVWARPGRWTEFEIEIGGTVYTGRTEGNRLFVAKL